MVTEVCDVALKIYQVKTNGIKKNTGTSLVTSIEAGREVAQEVDI